MLIDWFIFLLMNWFVNVNKEAKLVNNLAETQEREQVKCHVNYDIDHK